MAGLRMTSSQDLVRDTFFRNNPIRNKVPNVFVAALWVLMALSPIVFIEPAPYDLLVVGLFAVGLASGFWRFPLYLFAPFTLLLLFVVTNVAGLSLADNVTTALFYSGVSFYLILSWLFFVSLVYLFGEAVFAPIFCAYVFAACVSVLVGAAAYFGFVPAFADNLLFAGRVRALFKDPNVFGPFLVIGALYTLLRTEMARGHGRAWWVFLWGIISFGVLLSFSRAAWGNYVLSVPLYILAVGGANVRRKFRILVPVLAVLALALAYVVGSVDITTMLAERFGFQYYDQDRFQTQSAALDEAARRPFGIGPGQSETFFAYATHSLYLRVLVENGWLGFLAFAAFVALTLRRAVVLALQTRGLTSRYHTLFAIAITGVLFNSFFIDSLHWRHFWLLLALPWIPPRIPFETSLHHHQS